MYETKRRKIGWFTRLKSERLWGKDCRRTTEIMHNYQIKELNDFLKSRWSIFHRDCVIDKDCMADRGSQTKNKVFWQAGEGSMTDKERLCDRAGGYITAEGFKTDREVWWEVAWQRSLVIMRMDSYLLLSSLLLLFQPLLQLPQQLRPPLLNMPAQEEELSFFFCFLNL